MSNIFCITCTRSSKWNPCHTDDQLLHGRCSISRKQYVRLKKITMTSTKFIKAVLITGLIAGTLDASAASIQYYINTGNNPARVFRYIAGAVLGPDTKNKELYSMAAIGLLLHFLIATTWA